MRARIVQLSEVKLTPMARRLRTEQQARSAKDAKGKPLPDYEWQRLSYIGRRLKGGPSLLEVGPGRGYLSRMLAADRRYERQEVLDVVPPPPLVSRKFGEGVSFRQMSVADLPDPDGSYDTVLCMEVLEHLDDDTLPRALEQIRRVCARRLIMSVPLVEPLPLPTYHRQRFDLARLTEMFPNASFTILLKEPISRIPWVMIEEQYPLAKV